MVPPYWAETDSQYTAKTDIRCRVAKPGNLGEQIVVTEVWAIRLHGTPKADGPLIKRQNIADASLVPESRLDGDIMRAAHEMAEEMTTRQKQRRGLCIKRWLTLPSYGRSLIPNQGRLS